MALDLSQCLVAGLHGCCDDSQPPSHLMPCIMFVQLSLVFVY